MNYTSLLEDGYRCYKDSTNTSLHWGEREIGDGDCYVSHARKAVSMQTVGHPLDHVMCVCVMHRQSISEAHLSVRRLL